MHRAERDSNSQKNKNVDSLMEAISQGVPADVAYEGLKTEDFRRKDLIYKLLDLGVSFPEGLSNEQLVNLLDTKRVLTVIETISGVDAVEPNLDKESDTDSDFLVRFEDLQRYELLPDRTVGIVIKPTLSEASKMLIRLSQEHGIHKEEVVINLFVPHSQIILAARSSREVILTDFEQGVRRIRSYQSGLRA